MTTALRAITFDFGNTLVPVDRDGLRRVVAITGSAIVERCGPFPLDDFLVAWAEERERQFREDVPHAREVDLEQRVRRVLARLRGMAAPPPDVAWDDARAAALSTDEEVQEAVATYSGAFVEAMPPPPGVGPMLARIAATTRVGILSNWPLAATIDHYAAAAGWLPALSAIVVSQRVGVIKPDVRIFRAAERELGLAEPDRPAILHVGDDWAADVVGARGAGWRAAYLRGGPADTPLPTSRPGDRATADLVVDSLAELEAAVTGGGSGGPE